MSAEHCPSAWSMAFFVMTCLGSGMPFDGVCDSPSSSRCGVIAKQLVTSSLRLLDGGSPSTGPTKLAPALLGLPSVDGC